MTHDEAIKTIKDALKCLNRHGTYWDDKCNKALAALDMLQNDPMRLPELPEKWTYYGLFEHDGKFSVTITLDRSPMEICITDLSPRAAVLAAIARMGGEK